MKVQTLTPPKIDGITVQIPLDTIDEAALARFRQLVEARKHLLMLALDTPALPVKVNMKAKLLELAWITGRTPEADEGAVVSELVVRMLAMARRATWISSKQPSLENPKYAMRTFLIRLGLTGPEHKTTRRALTSRLEGCSAWRTPPAKTPPRSHLHRARYRPEGWCFSGVDLSQTPEFSGETTG